MSLTQSELVQLLKKKGTGATMSKHLTAQEAVLVRDCFSDPSLSLTTRATLLVAVIMLPMTDDEKPALLALQENPTQYVPHELIFLFDKDSQTPYQQIVSQVVSGKDLNEDEMQAGMVGLFDATIPEHEAAMFLEAERLKRETPIENATALSVLWDRCERKTADIPVLIDLSLGYDGFNRTPFLTLFLAPVLAEMGYPTLCHGIKEVAPKNGMTFYKVLEAAGKNPERSLSTSVTDLETVGWSYCDQTQCIPALAALTELRQNMVKRPVLATVEKLLQPIRSTQANYLVTGYTHPPYRDKMVNLLRERSDWDRFLVCRGVEGSIQLPLDRRAPLVVADDASVVETFVKPDTLGMALRNWPEAQAVDAGASLSLGLEALQNQPGMARDTLVYMASMIVSNLGLASQDAAYQSAQSAIASGGALSRFERFH